MTVSVLSNCLMHGTELPAHLPNLRDRLVYHAYKRGPSLYNKPNVEDTVTPKWNNIEAEEGEDERGSGVVTPVSEEIILEELTLDVLMVSAMFKIRTQLFPFVFLM